MATTTHTELNKTGKYTLSELLTWAIENKYASPYAGSNFRFISQYGEYKEFETISEALTYARGKSLYTIFDSNGVGTTHDGETVLTLACTGRQTYYLRQNKKGLFKIN